MVALWMNIFHLDWSDLFPVLKCICWPFFTLLIAYLPHLPPAAVPSGPVHNLTATIYSSTAVVISWDPPLEPNGRVFYQLSLQEAGTTHSSINRTVNITITKTTTDNIYLFTKLRKYFPYIIKVTPATSAGSAVNHTAVQNLRTDEDGTHRFLYFTCACI